MSQSFFEEGNEFFKKQDYDKALEKFFRHLNEGIIVTSQLATLYFNISSCYFHKANYTKALEYTNLSLISNQNFDNALQRQGQCFEMLNNYDKAVESYSKLFKKRYLDPNILEILTKENIIMLLKKKMFGFYPLFLENNIEFYDDIISQNIDTFKFIVDDKITFIPLEFIKMYNHTLSSIKENSIKFSIKDFKVNVKNFDIKKIYKRAILRLEYDDLDEIIGAICFYQLIGEVKSSYYQDISKQFNHLLANDIGKKCPDSTSNYFKEKKGLLLNMPVDYSIQTIHSRIMFDFIDIKEVEDFPDDFILDRVYYSQRIQNSLIREWIKLSKNCK